MSECKFNFEELIVYQKAIQFGEKVNVVVKNFPSHELYALSSQFRRAADSIALNIAEGYPGSDKQFIKHINISIFSANECVTCSTKSRLRHYYAENEDELIRKDILEIIKMLAALRNKIKARL